MTLTTSPLATFREAGRNYLWDKHGSNGKKRLDAIKPDLKRDLAPGWLAQYLLDHDDMLWRRWSYLLANYEADTLSDDRIPLIEWDCGEQFTGIKNRHISGGLGYKHISHCLDLIPNQGFGSWQGWSSFRNVDYFLDWLLYGLGYLKEEPAEPTDGKGASMRLYQFFDLAILQCWPWDYWGDLLADSGHGRHLGFFPTPLPIVKFMTEINFPWGHDYRLQSTYDPCVGTGRMLMVASNHSMNLYGQDISGTMVKCTLVNGYLYAPWLVRPPKLVREAKARDRKLETHEQEETTLAKAGSASEAFKPEVFGTESIKNKCGATKGKVEAEQITLF